MIIFKKWFGHRKRHFVVKTVVPRIKWKLNTFVVFRRKWKMKTILLTKECNGTKNKVVNKDDILDEIIQWYQEWRLKWRRHFKVGKRQCCLAYLQEDVFIYHFTLGSNVYLWEVVFIYHFNSGSTAYLWEKKLFLKYCSACIFLNIPFFVCMLCDNNVLQVKVPDQVCCTKLNQ